MASVQKHIALACNPSMEGHKATRIADAIAVRLQHQGVAYSLFTTYWPEVWDNMTEAWIIGGDGTVNYFINQYPDIKLPLTVFAAGSGNDFHWMLYGHMDVAQQVDHVLQAQPQWIDAGTCNGRLFLNGVGIGFDGAIVKDLIGRKKLAGKASYLLSILKHIIGFKEKRCTLVYDGETKEQDCFMISIANGKRVGGGFIVAPEAKVHDALLDVMVVGPIAPPKRIRYLPLIEKGEHLSLPFVNYRQTGCMVIQSAVALHAHIDGEYLLADTFHIQCLPNRFSFLL